MINPWCNPAPWFQPPPFPATPDAADSRARLLSAALRLFAEHGFAKTSIRQIAEAAGPTPPSSATTLATRKGLYNAAYAEPWAGRCRPTPGPTAIRWTFFWQFLTGFMRPLDMGDQVELCMRLHFREMLDPTGLWQQELDSEIKPLHSTLIRLLCQAVGAPAPTTTSTAWRWPSRPCCCSTTPTAT